MERLGLQLAAEIVYLEDFKDRVRPSDKLAAAAMAWLMPLGCWSGGWGSQKSARTNC